MSDEHPPDETPPPKFDVAKDLLSQGTMFLHLDPRVEGVVVPNWYRTEPQLVLQVGYDMPVPIPDLCVDDEGVVATLSFNRSPFTCTVPWPSVFALAGDDGRGMVWPDSMPTEIRAEIEREAGRRPPPEGSFPEEPVSNVVALVDRRGDAATPEPSTQEIEVAPAPDDDNERPSPPPTTPKPNGSRRARDLPPYLKVIK